MCIYKDILSLENSIFAQNSILMVQYAILQQKLKMIDNVK